MLRYLLAALACFCGFTLLLASALGDPAALLREVRRAVTVSSASPPAAAPPAVPDTPPDAALERRRAALRDQVGSLQAQIDQMTQGIAVLRERAEREQRALEQARDQHASKETAAPAPAPAEAPPPPPPQAEPQPPAHAEAPPSVPAQAPAPQKPPPPRRAGGSSAETVLSRLRQQAPPAPSPPSDIEEAVPVAVRPAAAAPSFAPARERLDRVHEALASGHIEEARRLLEVVQLQLVFRPVSAAGDEPPPPGRAASDVARALAALGHADAGQAARHVDQALAALGAAPPSSRALTEAPAGSGQPPGYPYRP